MALPHEAQVPDQAAAGLRPGHLLRWRRAQDDALPAEPNSGDPNRQIIIGQMFVQFQTPMKSKSWPLIMVHGSGYTRLLRAGNGRRNRRLGRLHRAPWHPDLCRRSVGTRTFRLRQLRPSTRREICSIKATSPAALQLLPFVSGKWGTRRLDGWFGHIVPGDTGRDHHQQDDPPWRPGDPLCPAKTASCNPQAQPDRDGA